MPKTKKVVIHIRIDEELIETSDVLQQNVLKDDELTFFKAHTGSKNSWFAFIFCMGLKKAKDDIEKFKSVLE
jgi:hypothetical protein